MLYMTRSGGRRSAGRTTRSLIATMAVSLALVLSGCGGDAERPAAASDSVAVAILEPDHLTPGWTTGAGSFVMAALFAPLVTLDDSGTVENVHAESVTSTDNREWTIKLKEGWTFHNGEQVTAQDYANTLNYTAYGPNGWGANYKLTNVEGYEDLNPGSGIPVTDTLSGIAVIDDLTLKITLKTADSEFPYQLLYNPYVALPAEAFDDLETYDRAPVGSGPFRMDGEWEHNTGISLERWDEYQGHVAQIDRVDFKIYTNGDAAYTDFQAGNVDITGYGAAIPQAKFAELKDSSDARLIAAPSNGVQYLAIPTWDRRFADVRVRQAISMAIDRVTLSEQIYAGLYEPATGFLYPGLVGGGTTSCGEACEFDPDRAKSLLADAGGWSGAMPIYYPVTSGESFMQAIANGIRQTLGIEVELKSFPNWAQYSAAMDEKEFDGPYYSGWSSPIPTPGNVIGSLFRSTSGLNLGVGGYSSPELDQQIDAAASATSADEATQQYHDVERSIMEGLFVVPILWQSPVYAMGPEVAEVRFVGGIIDYGTLTLS